jgi:hypothetical protein
MSRVVSSFVVCLFIASPLFAHPAALHKQTTVSADFDASGAVDFTDFLLFAAAFGQSVAGDNAKFDLDGSGGVVEFNDFLVFASLFGQGGTDTNDFGNEVTITVEGDLRVIRTNSLPNHETGEFPNDGNPHSISENDAEYSVPATPAAAATTTSVLGSDNRPEYKFGIATNGIVFDPVTAEFWKRDASTGWNIEAIGTLNLGLDENQAHVQPDGTYHYHGVPHGLISSEDGSSHSVLYGYAADGFPIYIVYGTSDPNDSGSSVTSMRPSYRLMTSGKRPVPDGGPGGDWDGTYTQDYEYVDGLGDLDECNGRTGITPDHPEGVYHYFITDSFPFHPRCFKGAPNSSFKLGPP